MSVFYGRGSGSRSHWRWLRLAGWLVIWGLMFLAVARSASCGTDSDLLKTKSIELINEISILNAYIKTISEQLNSLKIQSGNLKTEIGILSSFSIERKKIIDEQLSLLNAQAIVLVELRSDIETQKQRLMERGDLLEESKKSVRTLSTLLDGLKADLIRIERLDRIKTYMIIGEGIAIIVLAILISVS